MDIENLEPLGRLREGDICVLRITRRFPDEETWIRFRDAVEADFARVGCKVVLIESFVELVYPHPQRVCVRQEMNMQLAELPDDDEMDEVPVAPI